MLATGFTPWPNDLKPTRYRFAGYKERADGKIAVTLDPCVSYRDFIGARQPEFAERFSEEFHPRNLAVTTVLTARDAGGVERLLITLRDNTQDVKPGGFHVSTAGVANISKDQTPTATAFREAKEESGAEPGEIADLSLRAFVFGPWTLHMEMIYFARLTVTCEEIVERFKEANERSLRRLNPKDYLAFLRNESVVAEQLFLLALYAAVPVGAAALLLHGNELVRKTEDTAWFSRWSAFIEGLGIAYSSLSEDERAGADESAGIIFREQLLKNLC